MVHDDGPEMGHNEGVDSPTGTGQEDTGLENTSDDHDDDIEMRTVIVYYTDLVQRLPARIPDM